MGFFDKLKKINIFSTLAHLGSELNDDFMTSWRSPSSWRTRGWT